METLEKPAPMPFAVHARVGPPLGHSLSSPVSGEMPSRLGPRNWPQSGTPAASFSFLDDWPNESDAAARISRNTTRPSCLFTVKVSNFGSRRSLPYMYTRAAMPLSHSWKTNDAPAVQISEIPIAAVRTGLQYWRQRKGRRFGRHRVGADG